MTQVLMNLLDNAVKYSPDQAPIEIQGWLEEGEVVAGGHRPGNWYP